jgi:hypothetical protein
MTIDRQEQIDEFVATWNETDPDARRTMIEQIWSDDGYYVDRAVEARGIDQISANIDRVHRKFPDRIYGGVAYVKFADSGRLRSVIGFFGAIPDEVR